MLLKTSYHTHLNWPVQSDHLLFHCLDISCCMILFCLFVCIVALRPKSTAMVIAGRSVHLTTLFPGQA